MVYGDEGNDRLSGEAGGDRIFGGPGDDIIQGGPDGDQLSGDDGNDHLNGGTGIDRLDGGPGDDHLADRGYGMQQFRGGTGDDTIRSVSQGGDLVDCGPGDDRVVADQADIIAPNCETVMRIPSRTAWGSPGPELEVRALNGHVLGVTRSIQLQPPVFGARGHQGSGPPLPALDPRRKRVLRAAVDPRLRLLERHGTGVRKRGLQPHRTERHGGAATYRRRRLPLVRVHADQIHHAHGRQPQLPAAGRHCIVHDALQGSRRDGGP
ncbi:MAG: hypothetical protein H6531_08440 [Actinobacteria bacterium]|nr:hypothetical protein [Actinomycetota bacterium]